HRTQPKRQPPPQRKDGAQRLPILPRARVRPAGARRPRAHPEQLPRFTDRDHRRAASRPRETQHPPRSTEPRGMTAMHPTSFMIPIAFTLVLSVSATACGGKADADKGSCLEPKAVTDMLHAVMEADRTNYTKQVVNRLIKEQKVKIVVPDSEEVVPLGASEQWKSEHGKLPLPAQMFRMGSEAVNAKDVGFTYGLLSLWPVNKQNKPKTEMESQGLEAVASNGGKEPFYGEEEL